MNLPGWLLLATGGQGLETVSPRSPRAVGVVQISSSSHSALGTSLSLPPPKALASNFPLQETSGWGGLARLGVTGGHWPGLSPRSCNLKHVQGSRPCPPTRPACLPPFTGDSNKELVCWTAQWSTFCREKGVCVGVGMRSGPVGHGQGWPLRFGRAVSHRDPVPAH